MTAELPRPDRRVATLLVIAVGALAATILASTCAPSLTFSDSGELIAAADSFGVAHPPGYPLYTALGRLAISLPIEDPARAMNLLSALFGVLCCATVAWLILRWTGSCTAAAGTALGLLCSATFWSASTIAEVYTLHLALLALLLALATELGEPRYASRGANALLLGLALTLGFGISHRPTIILALPAIWILSRRRCWGRKVAGDGSTGRTAPWVRWLALLLVLGVPIFWYGTLIARARLSPLVNWGAPTDLSGLLAHLSTKIYGHYFLGAEGWLRGDRWLELLHFAWREFGYLGLPLALTGLVGKLRHGPRLADWRVTLALLMLGLPLFLFGMSYGTEDVQVIFLPFLLVLVLCCGLGIAVVEQLSLAHARKLASALALGLVLLPLLSNYHSQDLSEARAALHYGRDMLHSLPQRSVLFVEGDESFILAYFIQVRGERADLEIYDRDGNLFRDELNEPGSPPLPGEFASNFRIRREREFIERELASTDPRPLLFMSWPGYELPQRLRFEPAGLFYRVRRAAEPRLSVAALWAGYHEASIRAEVLRLSQPFGLTVAATYPLMRGERALFEGDHQTARAAFAEAGRLARTSESVHNYLGTVYGRLGDYPAAIAEFEEALRCKPVSVRAWNNLALARALEGDLAGAREAWVKSLELDPLQPDIQAQLRNSSAAE